MEKPQIQSLELVMPFRPQKVELTAQTEAYLLPIDDTELVRIDFMFPGGQWVQTLPLQARFAIKSLVDGANGLTAEQINEQLDYLGATVSASANLSYSFFTLNCLRKQLDKLLPLVCNILFHPLYNEKPLQVAISQARTSWLVNHQKVETQGKELLYRCMFGEQHTLGRSVRIEDYDSVCPKLLHQYHDRFIHPANCKVIITGGYHETDIHQLSTLLSDAARHAGETGAVQFTPTPIQPSAERLVEASAGFDTVQAAVRVGATMPTSDHRDQPLIRLVASILGGYFGSRLMSNVRETHGYTYDIHGTMYNVPFGNAYVIKTETSTRYAHDTVRQIHAEMRRLATEPISTDELQNVRNYMTGHASRRYEWNFNLPQVLMNLLAAQRTFDDLLEEYHQLHRATPEEIMDVAVHYFAPERFTNCIVR